jgi:hypothetical protein
MFLFNYYELTVEAKRMKFLRWEFMNMPIYYIVTYSMEQSPSWEANRNVASQEISRILWNPNVHYRIHKARHLSLSWASSIQSILPHPTSEDPS